MKSNSKKLTGTTFAVVALYTTFLLFSGVTQGQLDPSKGGSSKDDGPAEKKTVKQEFGDPSKSEFVKDIFSSNVESEDSAAFPDEALQIEKGKEQQQSKLKKNDEFHGPPATTETTIASTTTDLLGHLDVSTNTRSSFSENTSPESDPFQPTTEGTAELTPEKLATTEKPIAAENTSSNKPTTESEHKEEHRAGVSDVSSPDAKQLDETTITPPTTEVTLSTAPPIISSSRSTTSPHDGTTSVNPKADVVSTEPTAEQLPFSSSPITPAEQSSSTSSSGSGDETIIAGDKSIFLKGTTAEDEVTAVKFNETERTTNTPAEATVLKFKDVGPHPDPDQSPSNTNGSSHSEHPTPPPPAIQIEEEEEESTTSSIPTDTINSEGNVTTTTPSPKTGLSDENATEPSSAATSSADVELSKEPFDSHKLPVQFSTDTEGSTTDIPKIGGTEESGNLTVDLVPQTSVTDHPEPFVDLSVTNNSNNASSHDHEHHNHEHNEEEPSPMETEMAKAVRTSFSIRFPDIEFRPEFADSSSGQFRKFRDQIINEVFYRTENTIKIVALKLRTVLKEALGRDNFIDFDLVKLRQGSVIAEGTILTQRELMDPVDAVGRVREALATNNGGKLGGNVVESASVTVENASSNGVALHNESASNFGYIVVGSLVLAILVIVFAVFACIVFGVNKRNGRMKLRTNEIAMVENGTRRGGHKNGGTMVSDSNGVNLTRYGQNPVGEGNHPAEGLMNSSSATKPSPMILNGSQFSCPNAFK